MSVKLGLLLGYSNEFGESGPEPHMRWGSADYSTYSAMPLPLLELDEAGLLSSAGESTELLQWLQLRAQLTVTLLMERCRFGVVGPRHDVGDRR